MAEQQKSPFDRVPNGYDPRQVAAFAADALAWKRELGVLRPELESALRLIERYESALGTIESVEREAAGIVGDAERRSTKIIGDAEGRSTDIIEAAQRLAAEIIERAEDEAAEILEMAQGLIDQKSGPSPKEPVLDDRDQWIKPERKNEAAPDEVDEIFEEIDQDIDSDEDEVVDPEAEREARVAAAAANLWKRRGVIAPPE